MRTDSLIESRPAWALSQLQPSRNSRMETRTGRCSDAVQCVWATLRQIDMKNGRDQGFVACWVEPPAQESRRPASSSMKDDASGQSSHRWPASQDLSDRPLSWPSLDIDLSSL